MSAELSRLGEDVADAMRAKRAENWRRNRAARTEQLEEVTPPDASTDRPRPQSRCEAAFVTETKEPLVLPPWPRLVRLTFHPSPSLFLPLIAALPPPPPLPPP